MRIKPAGRLVEHQHLWIAKQRLRDGDALAKAARQLSGRQIHDAAQIETVRGRIDRACLHGSAQSLDARHEMQELGDPHVVVERRIFGHVADGLAHRERFGDDVMAGDLDAAKGRRQVTGQDAEDRALAGTVRAEEPDHLAGLDGERHVGDGASRPVPFGHMLRRDDRDHDTTRTTYT